MTTYMGQKVKGNEILLSVEKKFIKAYKHLPELWNPNHPDYANRYKRNAAYDTLVPIFREYMPKATRVNVRQKINIFRSCYRKELRRHFASKIVEPDGKELYTYTPTNWKFKMLRFLDCDEETENDNERDDSSVDETFIGDDVPELEYIEDGEESGNEDQDSPKNDGSPLYGEEELQQSRKRSRLMSQSSNEDDVLTREFKAVGSNVACKLQRMTTQQRYHAELLINKILIKGLKEQLTDEMDLTDSWRDDQVSMNYSTRNGDMKVEAIEEYQSDS